MNQIPSISRPASCSGTRLSLQAFLLTLCFAFICLAFARPVAAQVLSAFPPAELVPASPPTLVPLPVSVSPAALNEFNHPFRNAWIDGTHLAVCHFQMTCTEYGNYYGAGTISGYEQSIQAARAMGWDGFSLDLNGASTPFLLNLVNIFAACNDVNAKNQGVINAVGVGDFKLYITFDMSTFPEDSTLLAATFARFAKDPAYMTYQGRPIFSTYTGEGGGWAVVKSVFGGALAQVRAQGINPFFMPGFIPTDAAGNYSFADLSGWANGLLKGFADAAWIYGVGDTPVGPYSGIPTEEAMARAVEGAGLLWQSSITPDYSGLAHSSLPPFNGEARFWWDFNGGEGQNLTMNSILQAQHPFMIQGVTWNDFDEGSNYSSADVNANWPYLSHGYIRDYYKSKLGLQAETRYQLQRYKTGQAPAIVDDTLIVHYRTQPRSLLGTSDKYGPILGTSTEDGEGAPVADVVYVTALTQAAGIVQMQVGGTTVSAPVPAGVSRVRLPFVPGTPKFTLQRDNSTVLQLSGDPIVSTATDQDWNPFTAVSLPGVKFTVTAAPASPLAVNSVGIYASAPDAAKPCFGIENFAAAQVLHTRTSVFTQNNLNGPVSGALVETYLPALGDAMQPYTQSSGLKFSADPAPGKPGMAAAAGGAGNVYWVSGKRMPGPYVRLDLDIKHPADDPAGSAGLAFLNSAAGNAARNSSGTGYVARIQRSGAIWDLQLLAYTSLMDDQYTVLGDIPINPMTPGSAGHLTLEDSGGTFTATWTPAQ